MMDTYPANATNVDKVSLPSQQEVSPKDRVTAANNPRELNLRRVSSVVMKNSEVMGLVALEAGRRSGVPGNRKAAKEYREIADLSLEWLSKEGVL